MDPRSETYNWTVQTMKLNSLTALLPKVDTKEMLAHASVQRKFFP